jgi:hypothetical protein
MKQSSSYSPLGPCPSLRSCGPSRRGPFVSAARIKERIVSGELKLTRSIYRLVATALTIALVFRRENEYKP